MIKIYGFDTFNPLKVLYVATHLELDFEYIKLDPKKGEHRTPDFLKIHPLGKVPAIDHDGQYLFESGAICKYLCQIKSSQLYPEETYQQALVDQWMYYFTCHFGRWLGTLYFEKHIKSEYQLGQPDSQMVNEANEFIQLQAKPVNEKLKDNQFLLGDQVTLADYFGFSYLETMEKTDADLTNFSHLLRWYQDLRTSKVVDTVKSKY